MTALLTREEALAAVRPFEALEERTFSPSGSYGFQVEGERISFGFGKKRDRLPVTDEAWDFALRLTGLANTMMAKYPAELVAGLVQYTWERETNEFRALVKDDAIVAFASAEQPLLSPKRLLILMERSMGGKKVVRGYRVGGDFARQFLTVVGGREASMGTIKQEGIKVKDLVHYGAVMYYSPVGLPLPGTNSHLRLNGFAERLVCTNGMVSTQNMVQFNRKSAENDFEEWLTDKVGLIYSTGEAEFDRMRALKDTPIGDHLSDSLASIFQQFAVPARVRGYVGSLIADHPITNLWGLLQHVTYVASNYERVIEDPFLQYRVQSVGGSIVQHHAICPTCHQLEPKHQPRLSKELAEVLLDREN